MVQELYPQNERRLFSRLVCSAVRQTPRHAVCNQVLNLLSQVVARIHGSALAEAYRVSAEIWAD